MANVLVFADESGNMDFSRGRGASRYFVLTTITAPDWSAGDALLRLRRDMAWDRHGLNSELHATENDEPTRSAVFEALAALEFRIDATLFEKSKVGPYHRVSDEHFYFSLWYEHIRRVAPAIATRDDELLVISSTLQTKKRRKAFLEAVSSAVGWLLPHTPHRAAHWQCHSEPCLQAADYCCWAIQRKWENGDDRYWKRISPLIASEVDETSPLTRHWY